jgi:RsmE family RNA methyltransferase
MEVSGPVGLDELGGALLVTDLTGSGAVPPGASRYTVLVGPEGGLSEDEMPLDAARIRLSNHVLRTETAAIVCASAVLKELDR